jgi:multicomponent Na+:H+ antiporter subunit A
LRPVFNALYDAALNGLLKGAVRVTRVVQNGTLRYYLMTILLAGASLVGWTLITRFWFPAGWSGGLTAGAGSPTGAPGFRWPQTTWPTATELLLAATILAMALAVARVHQRLAAIAGLGIIGALVSLLFVLYSAPDLALTQLIIETLMIIVLLLVFHFLPRFFHEYSTRWARGRDLAISAFVGLVMAALVLFATGAPPAEGGIGTYFVENSYKLAHGRNVVNIILVDFRGLDTLGEIAVLAIAAVGITALLVQERRGNPRPVLPAEFALQALEEMPPSGGEPAIAAPANEGSRAPGGEA